MEESSEKQTSNESDQPIPAASGKADSTASKQSMLDDVKKYKELWEMAVKLIELENTLINHRLTALLALEVFLGGGVGLILATSKFETIGPYIIGLLAFFGLLAAVRITPGIRAARRQIMAADAWLKRARSDADYLVRYPYPPPKGGPAETRMFRIHWGKDCEYKDYGLQSQDTDPTNLQIGFASFPEFLILIWVCVIGLVLWLWFRGPIESAPLTNPVVISASASRSTVDGADTNSGKTIARTALGHVPKRIIVAEFAEATASGEAKGDIAKSRRRLGNLVVAGFQKDYQSNRYATVDPVPARSSPV